MTTYFYFSLFFIYRFDKDHMFILPPPTTNTYYTLHVPSNFIKGFKTLIVFSSLVLLKSKRVVAHLILYHHCRRRQTSTGALAGWQRRHHNPVVPLSPTSSLPFPFCSTTVAVTLPPSEVTAGRLASSLTLSFAYPLVVLLLLL